MSKHEWEQGDDVWFWSEKAHEWLANTIWSIVAWSDGCILDRCPVHPKGYAAFPENLRRRDPALKGKDKPKEPPK